jgi:hypothetical protein
MNALDSIEELAQDWVRHLRATNRSARTIEIYRSATESLADYLREKGESLSATEIGRRELERGTSPT